MFVLRLLEMGVLCELNFSTDLVNLVWWRMKLSWLMLKILTWSWSWKLLADWYWALMLVQYVTIPRCLMEVVIFYLLQVRFGGDSEWPEGEDSLWPAKPVPGTPEGRPGSDCKGRILNYAWAELRGRRAMVYKRHRGEVGAFGYDNYLWHWHFQSGYSHMLLLCRFVRFVSTPEVLERVTTIESEILQLEDAISIQSNDNLGLRSVSRRLSVMSWFLLFAERWHILVCYLEGRRSWRKIDWKQRRYNIIVVIYHDALNGACLCPLGNAYICNSFPLGHTHKKKKERRGSCSPIWLF